MYFSILFVFMILNFLVEAARLQAETYQEGSTQKNEDAGTTDDAGATNADEFSAAGQQPLGFGDNPLAFGSVPGQLNVPAQFNPIEAPAPQFGAPQLPGLTPSAQIGAPQLSAHSSVPQGMLGSQGMAPQLGAYDPPGVGGLQSAALPAPQAPVPNMQSDPFSGQVAPLQVAPQFGGQSVAQPGSSAAVPPLQVPAQAGQRRIGQTAARDSGLDNDEGRRTGSNRAEVTYRRNGLWSFLKGTGKRIWRFYGGLGRGSLNVLRLGGEWTANKTADAAWGVAGDIGDIVQEGGRVAQEAYNDAKREFKLGLRKSAANYKQGRRSAPQRYPGCENKGYWHNGFGDCGEIQDRLLCRRNQGFTCAGYEVLGWCGQGRVLQMWSVGRKFKSPEKACCACGGGKRGGGY